METRTIDFRYIELKAEQIIEKLQKDFGRDFDKIDEFNKGKVIGINLLKEALIKPLVEDSDQEKCQE